MSTRLSAGDLAPQFSLPDADGNLVSLADFAGKKVVIYFYPAAMTPGCTIEAIDFSTSLEQFKKAGFEVVGISPDEVEKIQKFKSKENLSVTLLADPSREVLKAYGAWGMRQIFGKAIRGVIRSTFIVEVDSSGQATIESAEYSVRAKGHVDRLKKAAGI